MQRTDPFVDLGYDALRVRQAKTAAQLVDGAHDHITPNRLLEKKPFGEPVFRHIADAIGDRILDRADLDRFAIDLDLAVVDGQHAKDRQRQLGAPGSQQAGNAYDLARIQVE